MKLIAIVTSLVVIATLLLAPATQWGVMRTPELFGDAHCVSVGISNHFAGVLWNGYVMFTFTGRDAGGLVHGEFRQVAGTTILNADGSLPGPVPFSWYRRTSDKFFGAINFRGHDRKFCGADAFDQLPCK